MERFRSLLNDVSELGSTQPARWEGLNYTHVAISVSAKVDPTGLCLGLCSGPWLMLPRVAYDVPEYRMEFSWGSSLRLFRLKV